MTTLTAGVLRRVAWAAVAALSVTTFTTVAVHAQRGQARPRPATQPSATTSNAQDSTQIVQRAYRALLNRTPSAAEVSPAAAQVQAGNLIPLVDNMAASPEAQRVNAGKSPTQMLAQIYQGLLDRAPGPAGTQAYGGLARQGRYADIVLDIVKSPEFTTALATPPRTAPPSGNVTTPTRLDAALTCEAAVLTAARRDANGRVFLTFDSMPDISGSTVSGKAVDRFNNRDRPLTYRCSGGAATYSYADHAPPTSVTNDQVYPSAAVRNCETAVRPGTRFDAASLSASDSNAEYVLGLEGSTVHECQMDRQRVVSVSVR